MAGDSLLDPYMVPAQMPNVSGMPDPQELERLKYMALMRAGLGMAQREPLGRAVGAGINTYFEGEQNARRNALAQAELAMKQHQAQEQYRQDMGRVMLLSSLSRKQLQDMGLNEAEIDTIKYAKDPGDKLTAFKEAWQKKVMKRGDTLINPATGNASVVIPDDQGVVYPVQGGIPTQAVQVPNSRELAAQNVYATEQAKQRAAAGYTFENVPSGPGTQMMTREEAARRLGMQPQSGMPPPQANFSGTPSEQVAARDIALRDWVQQQGGQAAPQAGPPLGYAAPKPPENYRWAPGKEGHELQPLVGGKEDVRVQTGVRTESALNRANLVLQSVADAKEATNATTAGLLGVIPGNIPGTKAYDLQKKIDMIKANVGFQELQAMREASPTGGALGQIAIQEINFLQTSVASLDRSQSPEALRKNLDSVVKHYNNWKSIVRRANEATNARVGYGATGSWEPAPAANNNDPLGLRQ